MAETETQAKRPSCAWPVKKEGYQYPQPCGSEERVFTVKGSGNHTGRPRQTPICEKHLPEAWKAWNVDSAEPLWGNLA